MALQSSYPLTLDQIKQEVFGNTSHPFDFLTCVDSSLLIDKSRPISFSKFLGYVDDITFTASPTSQNWAYNSTTPVAITVVVDSPEAHIHSIPSWITIRDYLGTQINAGNTIYKSSTPSYVLNVEPSTNTGAYRSADIVVHLTSAIGNAYQTQSGTTLNINCNQDAVPSAPTCSGFSVGSDESFTLSSESVTGGLSISSNYITISCYIDGGSVAGNRQIQVIKNGTTSIHNSTTYMASNTTLSTGLTLSPALASGDSIQIIVGNDSA